MTYSHRMTVRLGQFPNATMAYVDGSMVEDPIRQAFAGARSISTLNWAVAPNVAMQDDHQIIRDGLPERPFVVQRYRRKLDRQDFSFSAYAFEESNDHVLDFVRWLSAGQPGCIAVGFHVDGAQDGAEVFATDYLGAPIAGSRQLAVPNEPCVFSGPNIFAIHATRDVQIDGLAVFTMELAEAEHPETFQTIAEVAPGYVPNPKPSGWPYDRQLWENLGNLTAEEALDLRLDADALARANAPRTPDTASPLHAMVHAADWKGLANDLTSEEIIGWVADHLGDILQDPGMVFTAPAGINGAPGDGADALNVPVVPLLQFLARVGPIEALTLGNAVTLPEQDFDYVPDRDEAFNRMHTTSVLPWPLYKVVGTFRDRFLGTLEEYALAGVVLPDTDSVLAWCQPGPTLRPQKLDGPATTDIELWLKQETQPHAYFAALRRPGGEVFFKDRESAAEDDPTLEMVPPKTFLATYVDGEAVSPDHGVLRLGQVDIPLQGDEPFEGILYPRDMFGRWLAPEYPICPLSAWPVGRPKFVSSVIEYRDDESIALRLVLQWDRSLRRQSSFRFGLRLDGAPLDPEDGIDCPAFRQSGKVPQLVIRFDHDGRPTIDTGGFPDGILPHGLSVTKIVPQSPDDLTDETGIEPPSADRVHAYELVVPLGPAGEVLDIGGELKVVADATEFVRGDERSEPANPPIEKALADPRPPVLRIEPWGLRWASLPSGAGEARAVLSLPEAEGGGPAAARFHVWRAQETAVLDLVLRETFNDDVAADTFLRTIRAERNMEVRLSLIQSLVENKLKDREFERRFSELFSANAAEYIEAWRDTVEVSIPAGQTGIEFFMFTAMSRSGVSSEKRASRVLRSVAVPKPSHRAAPDLHVLTVDPSGVLEKAGLCIAIVSSAHDFEGNWVRFHWGPGEVARADSLLDRAEVVSEIGIAGAETYIPDIQNVVDRVVVHLHWRLFIVRPPVTWRRHNFAVDLKVPQSDARSPVEEIPTPRSRLESHTILPPPPVLAASGKSPGFPTWHLSVSDMPTQPPPGRTGAHLVVVLQDEAGDRFRYGPIPWADLAAGFATGTGVERFSLVLSEGGISVTIMRDSRWRLGKFVVSDPIRRKADAKVLFA